jgi:hypothetical protein
MTPSDRDAVQFTRESAERIANVVRAAELTPTPGRALSFEAIQQGASRKTFRMATFTGAWPINTAKVVTLSSGATLAAGNRTFHLPDIGTGPYDCAVARDGTAWWLTSALEQNVKRGTFAAPWSKGSSKTVTLVNGGSVSALNRHANITGTGTKACTVGRDGMDWELIAAEC